MIWPLLVQFLIYAAIFIASELLRPKPELEDAQAATFDDFQIPTTDPKRPIPIIWGRTRVQSPGIVWYGDYRTEAIEEEIKTGLFSSDDLIVGYKYFIGVQFGIAHTIDEYECVEWDDEPLIEFSPTITTPQTVSVNEPDFLGGTEGPSAGGGIVGDFSFFFGGSGQAASPYLSAFQDPLSNYKQLAHVVMEGPEVGTNPQIKPPAFIVRRYPNQLALTAGRERVGLGANPAAVLFEVLTDDDWGLSIDAADIDVVNFQTQGNTLFDEVHSYSNTWNKISQVGAVIRDLLRQIEGQLFLDFSTGLFTLKLIRDESGASPGPVVLNESNVIEVENFTRGNYTETSNRVVVNWKDPTINANPSPAVQDDMANQAIQNRNVVASYNFVGCDNATLATQIAARELRGIAFPLAKCSLIATRDAFALRPGDLFEFQWDDLGIESMIMRCASVGLGDSTEIRIRIDALQDVYSLGDVVYAAPQPTDWTNPAITPPLSTLADACFEVPLFFDRLSPLTSPVLADTEQNSRIMLAPVANQLNVLSFRMMQGGPNSPSSLDTVVADFAEMCPSGLLQDPIIPGDFINPSSPNTITVTNPISTSKLQAATAADIENLLANLFLVNGELFSFETAANNPNGTVTLSSIHRAKLDTAPQAHMYGDRVFFIGQGIFFGGGITDTRFSTGSGVVGARPNTTKGLLPTGSANACAFTGTNRIFRPVRPANFKLGAATASPIVAATFFPTALPRNDWELTWDVRDRTALIDEDIDAATAQGVEADTEVVLQFLSDTLSPQLRREVVLSPLTDEAFTYTVAQQDADFGGPGSPIVSPADQDIRVRLFSRRTSAPLSGLESHADWNFVVTRTGVA